MRISNTLYLIADINIKMSCLVGNVAKDYSAIIVVGDCIRLFVQLSVDELRDFDAECSRTQLKTRDGCGMRWGQLRLAKDERHLDASIVLDSSEVRDCSNGVIGRIAEGMELLFLLL